MPNISQIQVGSTTYNICDTNALPANADGDHALVIKDQSNESNILTVGWDGTMETAEPLPKESGGTGHTGLNASSVTLNNCTTSGNRC